MKRVCRIHRHDVPHPNCWHRPNVDARRIRLRSHLRSLRARSRKLVVRLANCPAYSPRHMAISPTRFHNSVHNAAAGYRTIGTGCMQASTALTAFLHSFAHGLLEAISQASVEQQPVLLVAYDIAACGALACVTASRGMLATALVLNPAPGAHSLGTLTWTLQVGPAAPLAPVSAAARSLQQNAIADCLPLLECIANPEGDVLLPLGDALALHIHWKAQHA